MTVRQLPTDKHNVLRRLREPGAFLVVARDIPVAGLFIIPEGSPDQPRRPIMTVEHTDVVALLSNGWIEKVKIATTGRASRSARYVITEKGRAEIRKATCATRTVMTPDACMETRLRFSALRRSRRMGLAV